MSADTLDAVSIARAATVVSFFMRLFPLIHLKIGYSKKHHM